MKSAVQMESEPMTLLECLGQCDEARSEAGALRDALDAVVPEIERLRANARDLAAERERMCAAIKAADDKAHEGGYMLDSDDCISVIRGTWKGDT